MFRYVWLGVFVASIAVPLAGSAEPLAKKMFGHVKSAANTKPEAYGSYAKGCVTGAVQLPETGPTWQAMRLSRNRNWGHPELVDFVKTLSKKAAKQPGWSGLYVGDMSQPRGGPMLTGHRSHQIGLDADIWMKPADNLRLTRSQREKISSISMRREQGAYTNSNWTKAHHNIIKAAAKDKRVARIFVFPGAKVVMCDAEKGDRKWLSKIRPWYGHHYHFHVRLSCPKGEKTCVNQARPPKGDGCNAARQWVWRIITPRPRPRPSKNPPKPRRQLTLNDLPSQCAPLVLSR